jgi:hypothetical protein
MKESTLSKTDYAPIVLFVYNRPLHTAQTLDALSNNYLAKESILYIYCDGAKENTTEITLQNILEVDKIVKSKQWCKEVHIIKAQKNKGLANSIKSGVTEIIQKYGKVIVMEDDLITSPAFLTYMNKALDYYEKRKSVFSISSYNLPANKMEIPQDYEYDVYVSLRNGSWGWATWADRWNQVDWNVSNYKTLLNDSQMQKAFNRGGDDIFPMLEGQQSGKLNIWSIQFTLAHFENHAVSIIPTFSYVDNIGLDGTGENCNNTLSLKNYNLCQNEKIKFLDVLYEDKRIINAFYSTNCNKKRPLWQKIINRISRILGHRNIFVIKKKIYN